MKLLHDFGVSALALIIILVTMGVGGVLLVVSGNQPFAIAWIAALSPIAKGFYDGYIAYKSKMNGAPPSSPG